jgi:hypothetical protein
MYMPPGRARAVTSFLLGFIVLSTVDAPAQVPASVGIPGSYQSEAGCPGDWDHGCPATQLV